MGKIYRGATPTLIFTFEDFDPTTAEKIILSFSNGLDITEEDMDITADSISVWLTQEQTLGMRPDTILAQFNFLFADGQRVPSEKKHIIWDENLYNEVMR